MSLSFYKTDDFEEEVLKIKASILRDITEKFKNKAEDRRKMATSFPTFNSWEECLAAYNKLKNETGFEDNIQNTTIPTGFNDVKDVAPYMQRVIEAPTQAAKSAIGNDYISSTLKDLGPRIVSLWLLNTKVWDCAHEFFHNKKATDILKIAKESATAEDTTEQQLSIYITACKKFRLHCRTVLEDQSPFFSVDDRDVAETLPVSPAYLASLDRILASIINKRNQRLGGATASASAQAEPPHYQHYRDFFVTGIHTGLLPLDARRATGRGFEFNPENGDFRLISRHCRGGKRMFVINNCCTVP